MIHKQEFIKFEPKNYWSFHVESFEHYKKRLWNILSNFPDCIIEQWVYRHFHEFISDYWYLDFEKIIFRKETWDNKSLAKKIWSKIDTTIDFWWNDLMQSETRKRSWLGKYFLENWTWPVPIIIFDNIPNIIPTSKNEYHLLEWHMRLAYFRWLYRNNSIILKNEHKVWIASYSKK